MVNSCSLEAIKSIFQYYIYLALYSTPGTVVVIPGDVKLGPIYNWGFFFSYWLIIAFLCITVFILLTIIYQIAKILVDHIYFLDNTWQCFFIVVIVYFFLISYVLWIIVSLIIPVIDHSILRSLIDEFLCTVTIEANVTEKGWEYKYDLSKMYVPSEHSRVHDFGEPDIFTKLLFNTGHTRILQEKTPLMFPTYTNVALKITTDVKTTASFTVPEWNYTTIIAPGTSITLKFSAETPGSWVGDFGYGEHSYKRSIKAVSESSMEFFKTRSVGSRFYQEYYFRDNTYWIKPYYGVIPGFGFVLLDFECIRYDQMPPKLAEYLKMVAEKFPLEYSNKYNYPVVLKKRVNHPYPSEFNDVHNEFIKYFFFIDEDGDWGLKRINKDVATMEAFCRYVKENPPKPKGYSYITEEMVADAFSEIDTFIGLMNEFPDVKIHTIKVGKYRGPIPFKPSFGRNTQEVFRWDNEYVLEANTRLIRTGRSWIDEEGVRWCKYTQRVKFERAFHLLREHEPRTHYFHHARAHHPHRRTN